MEGAGACERAYVPPPGLGSRRDAARCTRPPPLGLTWGRPLFPDLCRGVGPLPSGSVSQTGPASQEPPNGRLGSFRLRPRAPRLSGPAPASLEAPAQASPAAVRSARSPLPGLPCPCCAEPAVGVEGVEEEDESTVSKFGARTAPAAGRPPPSSAATCSSLAGRWPPPPARGSRPLPRSRGSLLPADRGGGRGPRSRWMLALGLRCSLDAAQLLSRAPEL